MHAPNRSPILLSAFLFILTVSFLSGAHAAPDLSTGSTANYSLTASAQVKTICEVTDQPLYTQQACNGSSYTGYQYVYIYDDGKCAAYGDGSCYFSPSYASTVAGQSVTWQTRGYPYNQSLYHSVIFLQNSTGTPPQSSGVIYPGNSFTVYFNDPGLYYYYDSYHPWMRGTVYVGPPPSTNPITTSMNGSVDGSVGWTVIGLDNGNAVLDVNHDLAVSVMPTAGLTVTPVKLSGDMDTSIDLTTRVESAGTATGIIGDVVKAYLGPGLIGGYGYNVQSSALGALLQAGSTQRKPYTFWWVNGPLSNGNTVPILTGLSSITGDDVISVGSLGQRAVWIASSKWDESFNVSVPSPQASGGANGYVSLKMNWNFDKRSDLLLQSTTKAALQLVTTSMQSIYPCFTSCTQVAVKRTLTGVVDVSMKLTSTSLDMNERSNGQLNQTSPLGPMSTFAWISLGATGVAAAAAVGAGVWFLLKRKGSVAAAGTSPLTGPSVP